MALIRRFVALENRTILDVGCGLGMYVQAFRRYSSDVHGIDIDPEKIAAAGRELPNLYVASAEDLPFPAGMFDVVLSHEVIEHVTDDRRAIEEAVRVLRDPQPGRSRPGGRLVIFAPNRLYPLETHGVFWRGEYHFGNIPLVSYLPNRLREHFCPHVRAYTRANLRQLLAGQPVRIVIHTQVFPGYDKIARRRPMLGRLLRRLTYLMERTPARILGLSHLLIIEKTGTWKPDPLG